VLSRNRPRGDWTPERLRKLKEIAEKDGEVHGEAKVEGCKALASGEWSDSEKGLELPALLSMMLQEGVKWNFTKDSMDCFGLNIFVAPPTETTFIFGDEDMKKEWVNDISGENCAEGDRWASVAVSSEYDYFFVNLDQESDRFGAVRHIVNNIQEDTPFTEPPFENFLDVVEKWANSSSNEEGEKEPFANFAPKQKKTGDAASKSRSRSPRRA